MAVAHDASSESHTGTTGSISEASFSWTHTPVGTPKGVLVFEIQSSVFSENTATGITYGGIALTEVTNSKSTDSATEQGYTKAWFLGSSIPTGAQTVEVTRTNNTRVLYCVCATVTAGADTEIKGTPVLLSENQALAEQNVDDGSPGVNSLRYAGVMSGAATPPAAGANSTALHDIAFGTRSDAVVVETTAGQGSRAVGFSAASDDVAATHLAIGEVAGGGGDPEGSLIAGKLLRGGLLLHGVLGR